MFLTISIVTILLLIQNAFCASVLDYFAGTQKEELVGRIKDVDDFGKYAIDLFHLQPNVYEDTFLTTPELVTKYGYTSETHTIQTADGYILEIHRIPTPGGIPVYLQHGILDSSGSWVIMGPETAFAYKLSDSGYDVWMGNSRGNRYSRKHIFLSPEKRVFWDFSFHEIGTFDVPATIDHILQTTEYEKLHYIGHSQGTTAFWVMCAQRPGYCDKILSMQAMAPIAFLKNVKSPVVKAVAPFVGGLHMLFKMVGAHEFLPNNQFFKLAGQAMCNEEAITQKLCFNIIFLLTGYNSEQLNKTMLPAILGHVPAGSSTKQFIHYGQLVRSGKFRMFDHGFIGNLAKYGSLRPPRYDLAKVTAPVALHFAMNDWLADLKDVRKLQDKLPNVIKEYLVSEPRFNHLDFLIAMNSREVVQQQVISVMKIVEDCLGINSSLPNLI